MRSIGKRIWAYLELFFGILLLIGFIWCQVEIGNFGDIILSLAIGGGATALILNFISYKKSQGGKKCQIKKEQNFNA